MDISIDKLLIDLLDLLKEKQLIFMLAEEIKIMLMIKILMIPSMECLWCLPFFLWQVDSKIEHLLVAKVANVQKSNK